MDNKCPLTGRPCNKPRPFHVTEIQNKKTVTLDMCEDCLSAYVGHGNEMKNPPTTEVEHVVGELFNFLLSGLKKKQTPATGKPPCPQCGSNYSDIVQVGKVGCANCWKHFGEEFDAVIQRVQSGNTQHVGKIPKKWAVKHIQEQKSQIPVSFKIKILENNMQEKIVAEKYEEAAKIRDSIKTIKGLNDKYNILKNQLEEAVMKEKPIDEIQHQMNGVIQEINKLDGL